MSMLSKLLLGVIAVSTCSLAAAVEFNSVQPESSRITFTSKQMSVPIEGKFGKFSAQLSLDPAKPEMGRAQIDIDLNSIDAGNEDANAEIKRKLWFDTQNFPTARFVSNAIKASGPGRYESPGKLNIKGRNLDIVAPFTFKAEGAGGRIEGSFTIKRLAYGIGEGEWADTGTVANEVIVKFSLHVVAAPAAAATTTGQK